MKGNNGRLQIPSQKSRKIKLKAKEYDWIFFSLKRIFRIFCQSGDHIGLHRCQNVSEAVTKENKKNRGNMTEFMASLACFYSLSPARFFYAHKRRKNRHAVRIHVLYGIFVAPFFWAVSILPRLYYSVRINITRRERKRGHLCTFIG